MPERLELAASVAKLLRLLSGHRGRNDNCCQDHGYALVQHLTRRSSATAGGGELGFHFILHNSSFSLSVRRPAVGSSDWLGLSEKLIRSELDDLRWIKVVIGVADPSGTNANVNQTGPAATSTAVRINVVIN